MPCKSKNRDEIGELVDATMKALNSYWRKRRVERMEQHVAYQSMSKEQREEYWKRKKYNHD